MIKRLLSAVLILTVAAGISSKFINENNTDAEVRGGSGLELMRYLHLLRKCVNSQTTIPPALVKAGEFCLKDSRAQKSFDCFSSCIAQQFGALSERMVGHKMYLKMDLNNLMPGLDATYGNRSISDTVVSFITRCQVFMPDAPFFPVMNQCADRLNGVFTCAFVNLFKRYNCQMNTEQRELLAFFDLDNLYQFNNYPIST